MIKKIAVALVALTMVSGCGHHSKDHYTKDADHLAHFQEIGNTVNFDLNSSTLSAKAEERLEDQAKWLTRHKKFMVTVAGHCDLKGTATYNLALGAKRAEAVKAFLAHHGVEPETITTVSYGKAKPAAMGTGAEASAKNRRAVVTVK